MVGSIHKKEKYDEKYRSNKHCYQRFRYVRCINAKKNNIDMAEVLLFKPGYCNYYRSKGVDSVLIQLIWDGTELEDIQSLCPEKLEDNIDKLSR